MCELEVLKLIKNHVTLRSEPWHYAQSHGQIDYGFGLLLLQRDFFKFLI